MVTPLEPIFFTYQKKISYGFGHIWPYKSKIASVRSKTFLYDSLETREFLWVKTLVGIKVHFRSIFSSLWDQIKSCCTQESHQKTLKTCIKILRDVFNDMTEEFFLCQKSYGNTTRANFFYIPKKNQLRVRAHLAVQIKNRFGTIKDLPIWFFGNKGIFVSQNSCGYTTVWSSFSSDFLVFVTINQNWASNIVAKLKPFLENKQTHMAIPTTVWSSF